jgi:hypothetical protein
MTSEVRHERMETAITLMSHNFPDESYESFAEYSRNLPDAIAILNHIKSGCSNFRSSWELQQTVAMYMGEGDSIL